MRTQSWLGTCLLFGVLLAVLLAGCAHKSSIVGTWSGTQTSPRGMTVNITWLFTADGKSTMTIAVVNGPGRGVTLGSSGTYTATATTMTQTIQTMNEVGHTITMPHPVPSTYQYVLTGDTLKLTGQSIGTLTLTRQAA